MRSTAGQRAERKGEALFKQLPYVAQISPRPPRSALGSSYSGKAGVPP